MSAFRRVANVCRRSKVNRAIDAELRSHIEMRTEDNMANGMPPEDARRDALIRFGNRTAIKERATGEDAVLVLEDMSRDIRLASRQLLKSHSFTITAILTLG